jgi:hypothetical protein
VAVALFPATAAVKGDFLAQAAALDRSDSLTVTRLTAATGGTVKTDTIIIPEELNVLRSEPIDSVEVKGIKLVNGVNVGDVYSVYLTEPGSAAGDTDGGAVSDRVDLEVASGGAELYFLTFKMISDPNGLPSRIPNPLPPHTVVVPETNGPIDITNALVPAQLRSIITNVTVQSEDVPEIDAGSMMTTLTLLGCGVLILTDRRVRG